MLYCEGKCGAFWYDNQNGCQQEDADVFCQLTMCDKTAIAESYEVIDVKPLPGFSCAGRGVNYGNWMGQVDVQFTENMRDTHGFGKAIANANCILTSKMFNFQAKIEKEGLRLN